MTHEEFSHWQSSQHGIHVTFNSRMYHSNQSGNNPMTMDSLTQQLSGLPSTSLHNFQHNTLMISKLLNHIQQEKRSSCIHCSGFLYYFFSSLQILVVYHQFRCGVIFVLL
ncbi:hypothetical protein CEXT_331921 [Caerostris extrusa]|uniref:Uncharacterized protein n=1 Tax=Caerostris extrusa TaxID=172846 RepID=A0AAV4VQG9_CAEEX|nr:hypothetical protein CEXT_331921 [Caerostris extrusa]